MTTELFSIWDSAAQRYLEPFFAPTIEYAIRQFRQAVNKPDHQFNLYPEDYTLFHVGSFDQEEGQLQPLATPHSLGVAMSFIQKPSEALKVVNDA